jgi:hypothetical protein
MIKDLQAQPTKVDGNTGELIEVRPTTHEIVEKVSQFLDSKEKKVFFNGKRYAEYEDFQYIGSFYGITVKTFEPRFVEINGHNGFHAKAMLYKNNEEIGRAEAFCMDDEPNWSHKPLFQLASMAQTRAAAKAYSNIFRPIVRMAGIEGTPAEEMDGMDQPPVRKTLASGTNLRTEPMFNAPTPAEIDSAEEPMSDEVASQEIEFSAPPPVEQKRYISKKQAGLLWVKAKQAGISEATRTAYLKDTYGVDDWSKLEWPAMDETLKWIEEQKNVNVKPTAKS